MTRILVTGASGFVGQGIVEALQGAGHQVFAGSRDARAVPGAEAIGVDVTDAPSVRLAVEETHPEAVIHLVGIIAEHGRQTFERLHVEATHNVLAALKPGTRYLHMSALGANPDSRSGYFSSKARAEELVKASALPYTIFRPSLIFGPGDAFFGQTLKQLVSVGPVVPQIGDGHFPFRPVSRVDVSTAYLKALTVEASVGQAYNLTGPDEYSFRQLLELEMQAMNLRKPIVAVPLALMNLAVPLLNLLPHPPITRDQYLMLLQGNTANPEPARSTFDLPMEHLKDWLPRILKRQK